MADNIRLVPRSSLFSNNEERIAYLEKLLNMHIDPVGGADTAVIAVGSAMFGITLIFIATAWINRRFSPIRAKNLPMVTCLFVAGVLWFVGDIPMNGHVLLKGTFSNCKEWNIWARVLFCFWYTTVLVVRCYALDRVFNQNKPTRGIAYYATSVVLVLFYLGYSIVTQAMPDKLTISYNSEVELCTTTHGYHYVTVIILWVNWLVFSFMMIRLRNIQSTFNEFYESLVILAFGIAAMIKTSVVHFTRPNYPLILGYRVAETIGDAFVSNGVILVIIAYPVIRSIYRSKEYEAKWLLRLRTDGLEDMYDANMRLRGDGPLNLRPLSGRKPYSAEARASDGVDVNSQYFRMSDYSSEKTNTVSPVVTLGGGPIVSPEHMLNIRRSQGLHMAAGGTDRSAQMLFGRPSLGSPANAKEGLESRRIL
ncbi:hypothetical protein LPJ59_001676 [Coemansia sp. RSA 2399]|nr:hypothetical protein LPJ59_001676 [Coemansia sp. RSA 2399]KAJ1904655.1 hypothetical protein LPJ81_002367 [Coemansia sp. IMI 209127]